MKISCDSRVIFRLAVIITVGKYGEGDTSPMIVTEMVIVTVLVIIMVSGNESDCVNNSDNDNDHDTDRDDNNDSKRVNVYYGDSDSNGDNAL